MSAIIRKTPGPGGYDKWLPVYDLEAATSEFGPSVAADCIGWMQPPEGIKPDGRHFVAQVFGRAMEPLIPDGSYCIFRGCVMGAITGKVLLVQHWTVSDPETGGSYTVRGVREWRSLDSDSSDEPCGSRTAIHLLPLNRAFPPIVIDPVQVEELRVIAEMLHVV